MADFASTDHLVASMAQRADRFVFMKRTDESGSLAYVLGNLGSTWILSGFPSAGPTPTTAVAVDKTTAGALANFTNAGGSDSLRLCDIDAISQNTIGTFYLYDRLIHCGGLSGTSVAVQTINTPAIPRGDTNGVGVVGFLECYTNLGATPQVLAVSYTNTLNASGRAGTVSIPASLNLCKMVPILLQAGDLGIKSVQSVQLPGSTGTVGNFGITLARRVCSMPLAASGTSNTPVHRSGFNLGFPHIDNNACLWVVLHAHGATDGEVHGGFTLLRTG